MRDVRNVGRWGLGDTEFVLQSADQLTALEPLLRQSYLRNRKESNRRARGCRFDVPPGAVAGTFPDAGRHPARGSTERQGDLLGMVRERALELS